LRVLKWVDEYIEYTLSFLFYFYLTSIVFIEVVRRYFFNASSSWGEETAVYAFVWMVYIAAAKGVKERSHLSIDILVRHMGRRGKLMVDILSDLCFFILGAVIFYYSLISVLHSIELGQTMRGLNLSIAWATVGVPVGWFLIMVRVVQRFVKTIRAYARGEDIHTAGLAQSE
jgi:C4-dicarboxylate transporter DctQ subunit